MSADTSSSPGFYYKSKVSNLTVMDRYKYMHVSTRMH